MEKKKTKREKYAEIKAILEKANAPKELVELCDSEVSIITNKYDTAKMKKNSNKTKEYEPLMARFLEAFTDEHTVVTSANIDDNTISDSKKYQVFKKLMEAKKIIKMPKVKAKDRTAYILATPENVEKYGVEA